ncbi:hypothetical protein [Cytobacillus purgationiresistens]|uniref:Uncharacterized protein n=1 Tax=Cytobacillus purgationiresistens TaxID=863449 RepID=A0ABU0AQ87_9BACI|nr:hypothetical protein [Cytobacillus purgationiresistens]MDQ0272210.1 hypothetical protein [Cytobacillus purgationiresistens]
MVMRDHSILNLNEYRALKQAQGERSINHLHSLAMDFINQHVNIREKVRAKHLFRKKLELPPEEALSEQLQVIFLDWFMFDYKTVQGLTIFNLFIKYRTLCLKEYELIQAALCLSAVMEPLEIAHISKDGKVSVKEADGKAASLQISSMNPLNLQQGAVLLLRKVPGVYHDIVIGPVIHLKAADRLEKIKMGFERCKISEPEMTWRAYLKLFALEILLPLESWERIGE